MTTEHGNRDGEAFRHPAVEADAPAGLTAADVVRVQVEARVQVCLQMNHTTHADWPAGGVEHRSQLHRPRSLEVLLVAARDAQHRAYGEAGPVRVEESVLPSQKDVADAQRVRPNRETRRGARLPVAPAKLRNQPEIAIEHRDSNVEVQVIGDTKCGARREFVRVEIDAERRDG